MKKDAKFDKAQRQLAQEQEKAELQELVDALARDEDISAHTVLQHMVAAAASVHSEAVLEGGFHVDPEDLESHEDYFGSPTISCVCTIMLPNKLELRITAEISNPYRESGEGDEKPLPATSAAAAIAVDPPVARDPFGTSDVVREIGRQLTETAGLTYDVPDKGPTPEPDPAAAKPNPRRTYGDIRSANGRG